MKAYIMLAEGFEEVEAVATADVLLRAGIEVVKVKIASGECHGVKSAHGVVVKSDTSFEQKKVSDLMDGDAIILPGGQPGTRNLTADERVRELVQSYNSKGKIVAAICAAPTALAQFGVLEGKKVTCFPGCESGLSSAEFVGGPAVTDGNIITGKSMGCAIAFGLAIVAKLKGAEAAAALEKTLYLPS